MTEEQRKAIEGRLNLWNRHCTAAEERNHYTPAYWREVGRIDAGIELLAMCGYAVTVVDGDFRIVEGK